MPYQSKTIKYMISDTAELWQFLQLNVRRNIQNCCALIIISKAALKSSKHIENKKIIILKLLSCKFLSNVKNQSVLFCFSKFHSHLIFYENPICPYFPCKPSTYNGLKSVFEIALEYTTKKKYFYLEASTYIITNVTV